MKQVYEERKFRPDILDLIDQIDGIITDYVNQGFRLTVRQIYYQVIALDILPDSWIDENYNRDHQLPIDTKNTVKNYKKLAVMINDAKMAGLLDWEAIEDRTREFVRQTRWKSGQEILESAADGFHMDMWEGQKFRVFCVVEKEALAGVLSSVCRSLDIPLLAARGYPSGTVLREFAESDLIPCLSGEVKQCPIFLHLGDHDPSGIDMSRDLSERFFTFTTGEGGTGKNFGDKMFKRIALNMDQIRRLKPPPNPAKTTDSRFKDYRLKFGDDSWELDALKPKYLNDLITNATATYIDKTIWEKRKAEIDDIKSRIKKVAGKYF